MRDPIEVQQELDAAQADLEVKVHQLKQLFQAKLETPKKVIHAVEQPISFVKQHFKVVAAAVGVAVVLLIWRRRANAHIRASRLGA